MMNMLIIATHTEKDGKKMSQNNNKVAEQVDSLHNLVESRQSPADLAIAGLVPTAGEIALGMTVEHLKSKEAYLKAFNSAVE